MKLRNDAMEGMLNQLTPFMQRRDSIGYAAGRNARKLREGCAEWLARKAEAIQRYGEPVLDEAGNPTGSYRIGPDCDRFKEFLDEMLPLAGIKHKVTLFRIPIEQAEGVLSGQEIEDIYWMFTEGDTEDEQ